VVVKAKPCRKPGAVPGLLVLALVVSLVPAGAAFAQAYPIRAIRLVVPQSVGGSTDLVARPLARQLSAALQQPVIVENHPGAGSVIGTDVVAKAPPDGYTLLAVAASFSMGPSLNAKLPFDPVRDFEPITLLCAFPNILVVHSSLPVKSVQELIAYAKVRPGQLNFGSSGMATGTHLSMELFKNMTGIEMVHVPYKGGAPSLTALLAGEVQVTLATISTALPHVKAGKLRALAVTTPQRSVAAPEVPTLAESGVPGYDYSSWIGLLAPAETPPAIVARLRTETARIVRTPEMRALLALGGAEPVGNSPEEFAALIGTEVGRWRKVVAAAGITAN
jgi:tripartite-type tricarboxylate transporter receptor subunit TctC